MGFKHSSGCRVEGSGLTSGGMGGSKKGAARERGSGGTWGARLGPGTRGNLYMPTALRGDPQNSQSMETKSTSERVGKAPTQGGQWVLESCDAHSPSPHPFCHDTLITIYMTAATASAIKLTHRFLCLWTDPAPRSQTGAQGVTRNGLSNLSQGQLFPLPHPQTILKWAPWDHLYTPSRCPWSPMHPEPP